MKKLKIRRFLLISSYSTYGIINIASTNNKIVLTKLDADAENKLKNSIEKYSCFLFYCKENHRDMVYKPLDFVEVHI